MNEHDGVVLKFRFATISLCNCILVAYYQYINQVALKYLEIVLWGGNCIIRNLRHIESFIRETTLALHRQVTIATLATTQLNVLKLQKVFIRLYELNLSIQILLYFESYILPQLPRKKPKESYIFYKIGFQGFI